MENAMDALSVSGADSGQPAAASTAMQIREHKFQDKILDVKVCGLIIAMKDSYIIWVGSSAASFGSLDVAMMTSMDTMPIASSLMGDASDAPGNAMAKRLSMKLKAQVFLSYALPSTQLELQMGVERRLVQELNSISRAATSTA
mmetsp:Transcript_37357/g.76647  ORF Transcript_37357/g.76647 Transcript_37357/m.76647 type:complete len:144 (+) Transcript_37357:165-596(+)|eukprot:CAMPEP_0181288504 /NCGR_PEP_ID=MMETSP1101-20121128/368_1 /TAXON_ID=46948 /ORGANISM="Rhodomonas abbreviata, Strain Caron Lab Isolate" /LENGTH=143 /DNA_ID=CAMNT_0023392631 /DNA_START=164 /DNA_END=595 /DNA_ORIENTATION=+